MSYEGLNPSAVTKLSWDDGVIRSTQSDTYNNRRDREDSAKRSGMDRENFRDAVSIFS